MIRRDHPQLHQGIDAGDEARSVTAGIRHPLGVYDVLPVFGGQLREAIGPVRGGAVGGGGVDHPGAGVLDEGHRLHRSGIRQAEKDQIRSVEQFFPRLRVLPLGLVDAQQLDVLPPAQTVINLQAGGPLLAVDVYFGFAHVLTPRQNLHPAASMRSWSWAMPMTAILVFFIG